MPTYTKRSPQRAQASAGEATSFIRSMVARSATPFERSDRRLFTLAGSIDEQAYQYYLVQWAGMLSSDKTATRLQRFLHFAEIDETACREMFVPVQMRPEAPLPVWATTLHEAMTVSFDLSEGSRYGEVQDPVAFEDLTYRFVKVYRQAVAHEAGDAYELLAPQAHQRLERYLMERLSDAFMPSVYPAFQAFLKEQSERRGGRSADEAADHGYRAFVEPMIADGLQGLFERYPMLARIAGSILHQQIQAVIRFLRRLADDRDRFVQTFGLDSDPGQVVRIRLGISDPHKGGEGVMILTFATGWRLVYKPRSMDVGVAYNRLCEWINAHVTPQLRVLRILPADGYGWIEFARQEPCADTAAVQRYYQRAGMLLALTYLLDSTDYHAENVIAAGEHPVLIDLETLLQPQFHYTPEKIQQKAEQGLPLRSDTVMRSSLLPMPNKYTNVPNDSLSGFGSIVDGRFTIWEQDYQHLNTDQMAEVAYQRVCETTDNLPVCDGVYHRLPAYREAFFDGFEQLYRLLERERDFLLGADSPLRHFEGLMLRFLFRPTQVYSSILRSLLKPAFVGDACLYGLRIELLARAFVAQEAQPAFWPVLAHERREMLDRDVPCFDLESNSDSLLLPDGQRVGAYFKAGCLDYVQHKLNNLGDEDLKIQRDIIEMSISGELNNKVK